MAKKKTTTVQEVAHSAKFYLVKGYYDAGKWGKKAVHNAVGRGWVTAAEYQEITGEAYEA